MNKKQEAMTARTALKSLWSGKSWVGSITGKAQGNLNEDFGQQFDDAIDHRESEGCLTLFRDGEEDNSATLNETDRCIFQGLFGIRWDNLLNVLAWGNVDMREAKSFFYHAVKGDLHSLEPIHPNTLSNLFIAMQNYKPLFDDDARDEVIHWLTFEANQAYNRIGLKPSDAEIWKKKKEIWRKKPEAYEKNLEQKE